MTEEVINITNLRKDLYKVSDSVIKDGTIYNVSAKAGNFILISKEDYDSLIETLYLSSNPKIKQSLIEGKNAKREDMIPEEDVVW